jgi:hypothetical protein
MQVLTDGHDTLGNDWPHELGRSGAVACSLHLLPFQRSASGRRFPSAELGGARPTATQSVVDAHETLMKSETSPALSRWTGRSTCHADPVRLAAAAPARSLPTTMQKPAAGQLTDSRSQVLAMLRGSLTSDQCAAE